MAAQVEEMNMNLITEQHIILDMEAVSYTHLNHQSVFNRVRFV